MNKQSKPPTPPTAAPCPRTKSAITAREGEHPIGMVAPTVPPTVTTASVELLDGAAKSSGVIVVSATNDATVIDPALLRSGRLEKRIVIPRPNTEALIGILQHHLKADLAAVVASAPLIADVDQQLEILTATDPDPASADAPAASTIVKPATTREVGTHGDV